MLGAPAKAAWKTIVPERKEAIESVAFIGGRIVAQYLVDVQSRLSLFEPDGRAAGDVALPGTGTVGGFSGRERRAGHLVRVHSPLTPTTIHRFDPRRPAPSATFEAADAAGRRQRRTRRWRSSPPRRTARACRSS